jgi:hypothetical protein
VVGPLFNPSFQFTESAFRHGINIADMDHALSHIVGEVTHRRRDDFRLWIGLDLEGQPLEIGVILDWEDLPVIIHAMRLRKNWRRFLGLSEEDT